ncbi:hypothetical protein G7Z17_g11128 [Cylindrodendrum hubeiense]|uniref:Uncharacterized protein n=1 Tax=Cylindrodendrum hubeiense TaxID=595255 RepID=A0A9P5H0T8_9HYPO|nr:hypothetical protein G7Z17_g11128 [Cylindrodendrum hubeiense]
MLVITSPVDVCQWQSQPGLRSVEPQYLTTVGPRGYPDPWPKRAANITAQTTDLRHTAPNAVGRSPGAGASAATPAPRNVRDSELGASSLHAPPQRAGGRYKASSGVWQLRSRPGAAFVVQITICSVCSSVLVMYAARSVALPNDAAAA